VSFKIVPAVKKIIGNDLWNCMDNSINHKQQSQEKSSQTKLTKDEDLALLSNMFGAYLATHGNNLDLLPIQLSRKK